MTGPGAVWEMETKEIGTRGMMKVFKNQAASLRDFWEGTRVFGDKPYIIYLDETLTYAQTHVKVEAMAKLLQSYGVKKGDRVGIVMRNQPEWVIAFFVSISMNINSSKRVIQEFENYFTDDSMTGNSISGCCSSLCQRLVTSRSVDILYQSFWM